MVLVGLMGVKNKCDITISIDDDAQDDIIAMVEIVDWYFQGCEIVYGVRSNRDTDKLFKCFKEIYQLLKKAICFYVKCSH